MKTNILLVCILLFIAISACSNQRYNAESDFEIRIVDNKTITIIGYNGQNTSVNIPPKIKRLPVTVIDENAFRNKGLTSIIIPNSVTVIGENAFSDNHIANITFPNSAIEIRSDAFANNQLANITIPQSWTEIGPGVFANNLLTNITIPDSVTVIGWGAFANNQLTNITLPTKSINIKHNAFAYNQLVNINIPFDLLTNDLLDRGAFRGNGIEKINIPGKVNMIDERLNGTWVFRQGSTSLREIFNNGIFEYSYSYGYHGDRYSGYYFSIDDKLIRVCTNGVLFDRVSTSRGAIEIFHYSINGNILTLGEQTYIKQ